MKSLLFLTLSLGSVCGDVYYNAIVDQYFSPYMGAEDLISAHRGLEYTQDLIYTPPESPRRGFWIGMERFSELFFIWDPINYLAAVTQHEVFGHGYRIRTLHHEGAHVTGYRIDAPFPYGWSGGATKFRYHPHNITSFEDLVVASGGVEATSILANRLKLKWLQRGTIDARESVLYTTSEQDISNYIWITERHDLEDEGDIAYYVHHINKTYPKGHLSLPSLKKQALVNLLDPFTYYAIYAWWHYILSGKKTSIPMIGIGSYRYLPGMRLGLTPFGPEYYLDNFLVKDNKPIYFYLRGGHFADQTYVGFGIEHAYLWNLESLPWGLRLDVWYQPHIAFRDLHYSVFKLHGKAISQPNPTNPTSASP